MGAREYIATKLTASLLYSVDKATECYEAFILRFAKGRGTKTALEEAQLSHLSVNFGTIGRQVIRVSGTDSSPTRISSPMRVTVDSISRHSLLVLPVTDMQDIHDLLGTLYVFRHNESLFATRNILKRPT